ncbi:MAG: SURF1 family protein [Chloroflexi bacterium]|nr:SURF1 family protein [Chloroflexota bacterium]
MKRIILIFKTMFSRKWLSATFIVILGIVLMVRLGLWQLDRLELRRAENAALLTVLEAEPLDLAADFLPDDVTELKDRQIDTAGEFDVENQVVLILKSWQGKPGVHLITPFVLGDGNTAVLVDLGWIPQSEYEAGHLAQYVDTKQTQLAGTAALSQKLSRYGNAAAQPSGPQNEVYRVDVSQLQPQMPYELLPFYVLAEPIADNVDLPYRLEPGIDLSEGPHLSYALQWFLFAAILGIGCIVYVNQGLNKETDNEENVADASGNQFPV